MRGDSKNMDSSKRWEVAANVAVVCLCLMMMSVIAWKFVLPHRPAAAANKPPIGKVLQVPGVDWNGGEKTVVLALSTQCHFCSESAPFYRKLAEASKAKNVRVFALFPQSQDEARQYFKDLGVSIQEIRQGPLANIFVSSTPTLLIVNRTGVVTEGWIGKLPESLQNEVIGKL